MNIKIQIPKKNTALSAIRQINFKDGSYVNLICFTNDNEQIKDLVTKRCSALKLDVANVVSVTI